MLIKNYVTNTTVLKYKLHSWMAKQLSTGRSKKALIIQLNQFCPKIKSKQIDHLAL